MAIKFDNLSLMSAMEEEAEFIPLMNKEEEEKLMKEKVEEELPILAVKNMVLFPGVVIPVTASRDKSIKLLKEAYEGNKTIGVVAQKDGTQEELSKDNLYKKGTVGKILKLLKMPDGNTMVILQGSRRFEWIELTQEKPYFKAKVKILEDRKPKAKDAEYEAIIESVKDISTKIIQDNPAIPSEAVFALKNIETPSFLVNFVASNMNLDVASKQKLLRIDSNKKRAIETLRFLQVEQQKLTLKNDIQSKVRTDIDKQQREYFLNQQIKTIQEELGGLSYEEEVKEMKSRAKKMKWEQDVAETFEKEIGRMQRMNPQMPEYSIQRNYLEFLLDLPWGVYSKDDFDLKRATKILNKDQYGLDEVKERIIEHLAVLKLKKDMKSPILCLYGPPGVGKTSLGRSIARALGREYVRISLGGLHDESEIRGHRKTYIGAMAGRILQSIKKAKTANPVFVLDEIDKMGRGNHGDPSSALLEVLDPEQNNSFYDNFLERGFDLSKVMFIATANSVGAIPYALRDRMEMVPISGYTLEEKIQIAKKHLLPKQIKEHGLKSSQFSMGKKQLELLVEMYTRESGVRGLDKQLAKLVRYAAKSIAMDEKYESKISIEKIKELMGRPRNVDRYENNEVAGVVTGLAWTRLGGDILFLESLLSKGKGTLTTTGNMGKVMRESIVIALEFIKAHYKKYDIDPIVFEKWDVHIHIPEGAVPKDGPSAGVGMLTSLVSSFTQKKVKKNLAMTGEITLRGKVLPVGGIKEKILAAKRANIKEVILCKENQRDIDEIKKESIEGMKFHYVTRMDQVLALALTDELVKNPVQFHPEEEKKLGIKSKKNNKKT